MDSYLLSKDTYERKLKTQDELDNLSTEQMFEHLNETPVFMQKFDNQLYRVQFENKEEFQESQKILTSDEALVKYYENKDPSMLEGLRSKSRINVVGKKAEKKNLRKKFLESRSQDALDDKLIAEKRAELKKEEHGFTYNYNEEEIREKIQQEDTEVIMRYYRNKDMYQDDLQKIQEKVEGMSMTRRRQLKKLADKSFFNADQLGYDTKACREAQDEYAKKQNPNATYESYRAYRERLKYHSNHKLPDDAIEKRDKTKQKGKGEFYNRTATAYMKEVNYKIVDGKKVPKTYKDEKNLEYNNKWIDSLFTEDKELLEFRHREMRYMLEDIWDYYEKDIKAYLSGNLDYSKIDRVKLPELSKKILCLDGFSDKSSSLYHSDYFTGLPEELQKELTAKGEILTPFLGVLRARCLNAIGLEEDGSKFLEYNLPVEDLAKAFDEGFKQNYGKFGSQIRF